MRKVILNIRPTRCTKFYPEAIRIVYPASMLWRKQTASRAHPRVLRITGHRADLKRGGRQYSRAQTAPSNNRCRGYFLSLTFLFFFGTSSKDAPFLTKTEGSGEDIFVFRILEYFFLRRRDVWERMKGDRSNKNFEKYFQIFKLIFIFTFTLAGHSRWMKTNCNRKNAREAFITTCKR